MSEHPDNCKGNGWAPDWYREMQREHAREAKAQRDLAESRVHAILDREDMLTARCLLNQLINLDPIRALEMLQAGGRCDGFDDDHTGTGEAALDTAASDAPVVLHGVPRLVRMAVPRQSQPQELPGHPALRRAGPGVDVVPQEHDRKVEDPVIWWILVGVLGAISVVLLVFVIWILIQLSHMFDGF